VSRFLEWFHGQGDIVHGDPENRVRSERALRRDALAKKARTSRACLRKLEAGMYDLTVGTLQRLATALGVQ
jgi:ribosome-binding protein aMBF1 (putative translation factor)